MLIFRSRLLKNIPFILYVLLFNLNCASVFNLNPDSNLNFEMKKIRDSTNKKKIFTHKYLKSNIKAIPLLINTGLINKDNSKFTEMQFRFYNKKPINYTKITMSNANEQIWTWDIYKKNRKVIQKQKYTIETYETRVDVMTSVLKDFFQHEPIYLTFQGKKTVDRKLEKKHIISLLKVLTFAENSSIEYLRLK